MEIELKARLRDREAVLARVASFASRTRRFDKLDEYWHGPDWRFARGTKGFRLRSDGGRSIVTYKDKRNDAGIEINRETEFEVSDAAAFKGLVERIGCEPFIRKRKTGDAFEYDGFTIEVLSVESLGDFIEIERVIDTDDPAAIAVVQGGLKSLLARSGVPEGDIEGRTYSDMLLAVR